MQEPFWNFICIKFGANSASQNFKIGAGTEPSSGAIWDKFS